MATASRLAILWIPFVLCVLYGAAGALSCAPAPSPAVTGQAVADAPIPDGPLPRDVVPTGYRLDLEIDPSQSDFRGYVEIAITIVHPVDRIWLHGNRLRDVTVTLRLADGRTETGVYKQVNDDGVARIDLPETIAPQSATLMLHYRAAFDQHLEGLYRLQHEERWYAFTQFEAISARLCFPGFDEPAFKTAFDLTLVVPDTDVAIANTPALSSEPAGAGHKRIRFAITQPIPTYLIALAVGALEIVDGPPIPANEVRSEPIPLRGVTVAGKADQLDYALRHTGRFVEEFEHYFRVAYPYRKLDLVAVPDFAAGAMENVGLITFREFLLLLREDAPTEQKHAFAYTMVHELAHQWFGNLVTMPWWDDIWLNEAFATWLEYRIISHWDPALRAEVAQVEDAVAVMDSDSLVAARQIRQPIESSHDIHNAFDSITYSKGGGVLSMFERYIGEERFRDGVTAYLRTHSHGTANYEQFLAALASATEAEADIGAAFRSFLMQPGVPVLDIEPLCENGAAYLRVRQSRFFPVGSSGDANVTWQVPMCVRFAISGVVRTQCALITERDQRVDLTAELAGGCLDWIMPNADGAGYYRWRLPGDHLRRLRDEPSLSTRELLSVADAVRSGFTSAKLSAADALGAAGALAGHAERSVATALMELIRFARERLVADKEVERVEAFGRSAYAAAHKRLGLAPGSATESDEQRLFRTAVVDFLTDVGRQQPLRAELANRAARFVGFGGNADPSALTPDLVATALRVAVEDGDERIIEHLIVRLGQTKNSMSRRQIVQALGRANEPAAAIRVRSLILGDRIRANEIFTMLRGQMAQPRTRRAAWKWLQASFTELVARLPAHHAGYLPWLAANFCSRDDVAAVRTFFTTRVASLPGGPRNLEASLEAIELCAARVDAHRDDAARFFASHDGP